MKKIRTMHTDCLQQWGDFDPGQSPHSINGQNILGFIRDIGLYRLL